MATLRQIFYTGLKIFISNWKKNKIPYEIDIEPEPEEDTEVPNPWRHRRKLTKSRLVQNIKTALHPSNYHEIIYLNKHGNICRLYRPKM